MIGFLKALSLYYYPVCPQKTFEILKYNRFKKKNYNFERGMTILMLDLLMLLKIESKVYIPRVN